MARRVVSLLLFAAFLGSLLFFSETLSAHPHYAKRIPYDPFALGFEIEGKYDLRNYDIYLAVFDNDGACGMRFERYDEAAKTFEAGKEVAPDGKNQFKPDGFGAALGGQWVLTLVEDRNDLRNIGYVDPGHLIGREKMNGCHIIWDFVRE